MLCKTLLHNLIYKMGIVDPPLGRVVVWAYWTMQEALNTDSHTVGMWCWTCLLPFLIGNDLNVLLGQAG